MIYRTKNPNLYLLFKKSKIWKNYQFREEFNILGKQMKKNMQEFIKKRRKFGEFGGIQNNN